MAVVKSALTRNILNVKISRLSWKRMGSIFTLHWTDKKKKKKKKKDYNLYAFLLIFYTKQSVLFSTRLLSALGISIYELILASSVHQ